MMSDWEKLNDDRLYLHFQEGRMENYFESFLKVFGGTLEENEYRVDSPVIQLTAKKYALSEAVSMGLVTFESKRHLMTRREPDNDPDLLHLTIVSKGAYQQSFNDQNVTVDHETNKGAFLYNSLFPISVEFEADRQIHMIFFKFRLGGLGDVFRDSAMVYRKLFEDETPLSYHSAVGHKLNKLITDLFAADDDYFDSKAFILSRGVELFSNMSSSLNALIEKDNLRGLHPEDFNRLQRIKADLLSNFEEKVTMNTLAEKHGLSVSKLKRDFKGLFGMSVYKFYNHSRMDEAYRRLHSGKFSVSEVGYDLGYSNLSKFSEMFKRIKGISPSQVISP